MVIEISVNNKFSFMAVRSDKNTKEYGKVHLELEFSLKKQPHTCAD